MGCAAFSTLAQGLLSDKFVDGRLPADSRVTNKETLFSRALLTPEVLSKLGGLAEIAKERGQTLAQLSLAWALRDESVSTVVIGARSLAQIKENVKALDRLDFSSQELKKIDQYATDIEGVNLWPPNCQTSQV